MKSTTFRKQTPSSLAQTHMVHWPWATKAIEHDADLSPQAQHAQSMKLIWRPLDLILVLLLLASMAFTVLRGLVRTTTSKMLGNEAAMTFQPFDMTLFLSTLCRQLWTLHWRPAPPTFSTMSPTWRTPSASPVSWWLLCFSPRSQHLIPAHWPVFKRAASLTSLLRCLSVRLIEKPYFIITAARVRLSAVPFVPPSDKYQTTMWAEVIWSSPFLVADLTWLFSFPLIVYFGCVLCALCSVHTAFVNRLSKDLVGATVWAHLWVIDQTGKPHGENLIS